MRADVSQPGRWPSEAGPRPLVPAPAHRRSAGPRAGVHLFGVLRMACLAVSFAASLAAAEPTKQEGHDDPTAAPVDAAAASKGEDSIFKEAAGPLELTEEQRLRLEVISAESQEYAATIRAELQAARQEMKRLLEVDEPEIVAVMDQADEIGRLETRMRKHHLATLLSLRAVLSPAQRENLVEVFQAAAARKRALKAEAKDGAASPAGAASVTADAGP